MNRILKPLGAAMLIAAACFGSAYAAKMQPPQYYESMGRTAGQGESEVVIVCLDIRKGVEVRANGRLQFVVDNTNMTKTIVVPNNIYSVDANHPKSPAGTRGVISFNAKSSRVVLCLRWVYDRFELTKYAEFPLDKPVPAVLAALQPQPAAAGKPAKGIEGAAQKTVASLMEDIPKGSKIAVVNVSAGDKGTTSLVIDEIEFHLVSAKKFTIVDRKTLDLIRKEQEFQMGGEVSDASIVKIGELTGANIVIAGSVTGSSTVGRLSLKALDVKTGQIIAMSRESY